MQVIILLLLIPLCYSTLFGLIGTMHSTGIIGQLECKGMPASGVKVKLVNAGIIFNQKMQQNRTDTDGSFMLSGSARIWSKIDARLNIYHKCNYKGWCYRTLTVYIPREYVTPGEKALKYFNSGVLELSNRRKGETISCLQ